MGATLLARMPKVNTDVEFCPGRRAGDRVRLLAGSLSSDTTGQTVVIVARLERVHTRPGHTKKLNESVEKSAMSC